MYKIVAFRVGSDDGVEHVERYVNMHEKMWTPMMQSQSLDHGGDVVIVITFKEVAK